MNADDFVEVIPFTRLSESTRLWAEWLQSRGLQESDIREHVEREVGRARFEQEVGPAQVGSYSIIRVRRSALERLLPDEYGRGRPK
jgi:hypothetical protein